MAAAMETLRASKIGPRRRLPRLRRRPRLHRLLLDALGVLGDLIGVEPLALLAQGLIPLLHGLEAVLLEIGRAHV